MPKLKKTVKLLGKEFERAQASCSCCCTAANGDYFTTFRAGLVDSDGQYYSYLCGEEQTGGEGCLESILSEQKKDGTPEWRDGLTSQDKADILRETLGDDEDGIWSQMTE